MGDEQWQVVAEKKSKAKAEKNWYEKHRGWYEKHKKEIDAPDFNFRTIENVDVRAAVKLFRDTEEDRKLREEILDAEISVAKGWEHELGTDMMAKVKEIARAFRVSSEDPNVSRQLWRLIGVLLAGLQVTPENKPNDRAGVMDVNSINPYFVEYPYITLLLTSLFLIYAEVYGNAHHGGRHLLRPMHCLMQNTNNAAVYFPGHFLIGGSPDDITYAEVRKVETDINVTKRILYVRRCKKADFVKRTYPGSHIPCDAGVFLIFQSKASSKVDSPLKDLCCSICGKNLFLRMSDLYKTLDSVSARVDNAVVGNEPVEWFPYLATTMFDRPKGAWDADHVDITACMTRIEDKKKRVPQLTRIIMVACKRAYAIGSIAYFGFEYESETKSKQYSGELYEHTEVKSQGLYCQVNIVPGDPQTKRYVVFTIKKTVVTRDSRPGEVHAMSYGLSCEILDANAFKERNIQVTINYQEQEAGTRRAKEENRMGKYLFIHPDTEYTIDPDAFKGWADPADQLSKMKQQFRPVKLQTRLHGILLDELRIHYGEEDDAEAQYIAAAMSAHISPFLDGTLVPAKARDNASSWSLKSWISSEYVVDARSTYLYAYPDCLYLHERLIRASLPPAAGTAPLQMHIGIGKDQCSLYTIRNVFHEDAEGKKVKSVPYCVFITSTSEGNVMAGMLNVDRWYSYCRQVQMEKMLLDKYLLTLISIPTTVLDLTNGDRLRKDMEMRLKNFRNKMYHASHFKAGKEGLKDMTYDDWTTYFFLFFMTDVYRTRRSIDFNLWHMDYQLQNMGSVVEIAMIIFKTLLLVPTKQVEDRFSVAYERIKKERSHIFYVIGMDDYMRVLDPYLQPIYKAEYRFVMCIFRSPSIEYEDSFFFYVDIGLPQFDTFTLDLKRNSMSDFNEYHHLMELAAETNFMLRDKHARIKEMVGAKEKHQQHDLLVRTYIKYTNWPRISDEGIARANAFADQVIAVINAKGDQVEMKIVDQDGATGVWRDKAGDSEFVPALTVVACFVFERRAVTLEKYGVGVGKHKRLYYYAINEATKRLVYFHFSHEGIFMGMANSGTSMIAVVRSIPKKVSDILDAVVNIPPHNGSNLTGSWYEEELYKFESDIPHSLRRITPDLMGMFKPLLDSFFKTTKTKSSTYDIDGDSVGFLHVPLDEKYPDLPVFYLRHELNGMKFGFVLKKTLKLCSCTPPSPADPSGCMQWHRKVHAIRQSVKFLINMTVTDAKEVAKKLIPLKKKKEELDAHFFLGVAGDDDQDGIGPPPPRRELTDEQIRNRQQRRHFTQAVRNILHAVKEQHKPARESYYHVVMPNEPKGDYPALRRKELEETEQQKEAEKREEQWKREHAKSDKGQATDRFTANNEKIKQAGGGQGTAPVEGPKRSMNEVAHSTRGSAAKRKHDIVAEENARQHILESVAQCTEKLFLLWCEVLLGDLDTVASMRICESSILPKMVKENPDVTLPIMCLALSSLFSRFCPVEKIETGTDLQGKAERVSFVMTFRKKTIKIEREKKYLVAHVSPLATVARDRGQENTAKLDEISSGVSEYYLALYKRLVTPHSRFRAKYSMYVNDAAIILYKALEEYKSLPSSNNPSTSLPDAVQAADSATSGLLSLLSIDSVKDILPSVYNEVLTNSRRPDHEGQERDPMSDQGVQLSDYPWQDWTECFYYFIMDVQLNDVTLGDAHKLPIFMRTCNPISLKFFRESVRVINGSAVVFDVMILATDQDPSNPGGMLAFNFNVFRVNITWGKHGIRMMKKVDSVRTKKKVSYVTAKYSKRVIDALLVHMRNSDTDYKTEHPDQDGNFTVKNKARVEEWGRSIALILNIDNVFDDSITVGVYDRAKSNVKCFPDQFAENGWMEGNNIFFAVARTVLDLVYISAGPPDAPFTVSHRKLSLSFSSWFETKGNVTTWYCSRAVKANPEHISYIDSTVKLVRGMQLATLKPPLKLEVLGQEVRSADDVERVLGVKELDEVAVKMSFIINQYVTSNGKEEISELKEYMGDDHVKLMFESLLETFEEKSGFIQLHWQEDRSSGFVRRFLEHTIPTPNPESSYSLHVGIEFIPQFEYDETTKDMAHVSDRIFCYRELRE